MTRVLVASSRLVALVLALSGCGAATSPTGATGADTAAHDASARSRVGDYVIYRFFGRHIGLMPRLLLEEVVSEDANGLVLELTLSEDHAVLRRWRETLVGTDLAPSTRHVASFCALPSIAEPGETCTPLANEGDADRRRLYENIVIFPEGPRTDEATVDAPVTVLGEELRCVIHTSNLTAGGEALTATEVTCAGFAWGDVGAIYRRADERDVLHVSVEDAAP